MYVKIYPNESGYNYYYNEFFFSYQNSNKLKETDCEFAGFFFVLIVIYKVFTIIERFFLMLSYYNNNDGNVQSYFHIFK